MTEWLYPDDSYLREFEARVLQSGDAGVVLDRSAFYPQGGGQPSDEGVLITTGGERLVVTGLKRDEGAVYHQLEGEARPSPGEVLRGEIDWTRRVLLMRTHTALHMLSGVIFNDHGAPVTGGNMEPGRGRLDFEWPQLQREMLPELEHRMNEEVAAGRDIRIRVLPRDEAFRIPDLIRTKANLIPEHIQMIRIVDIEGLDQQADGGTHVANTREVGGVRLVSYKSKGKGNKRLTLELD